MADFKLTASQQAAVFARGDAVLVSAAAGSGKTRVLVERLMSYVTDEENPRDIDSFLVITYTRAAAAELKTRITDELSRRRADDIQNSRLRRQTALCQAAQICTIDSYCTALLREHGHIIGVMPDFKVPDADRAAVLKASSLEKLLEAKYEHIEQDDSFRALVDSVGAGRDDTRLSDLILSLHEKMRSRAYPRKWVQEQKQSLELPEGTELGNTICGEYLLVQARDELEYWHKCLEDLMIRLADAPIGNYLESISQSAEALREISRATSIGWDAVRKMLPAAFPRLNTPKGMGESELAVFVKSRRKACSDAIKKLAITFEAPSEKLIAELQQTAPAMSALLEATLEFDKAYAAEKSRQSFLDFADLEHSALNLLIDEETGAPTWLAVEICQRYTEVMVDEYQDVNRIQDLIFSAVSKQGKNLFMVGDVKQSIYRFRLADPTIFIEKYNNFQDVGDDISNLSAPARIFLQENFRSRETVLNGANRVFERIMSQKLGELDYDEKARLIAGASYPAGEEIPCEINVVRLPESGGDEEAPDKLMLEAQYVAERIAKLLREAMIFDSGALRRVRAGDIVILLRSPNSSGGAFRRALGALCIPVEAAQGGGFFSSVEISVIMSLLAIADNPHQDLPLISVLRSPLFGFTPDELASIRAERQTGDFYTALLCCSENEKSARFLKMLGELRMLSQDLPVSELIARAYDLCSATAIFSAMPDGAARRENLMILLEYAQSFEASGWRGLFSFVAWLRRLAERGEEPPSRANSVDSVRIMSIHKSKGLEFPIVFLSNTSRKFNKIDLQSTVLMHSELGLGPHITDTERGIEYPTAAFRAIKTKLENETLSEEMRLLYVALTRARERLIVTCSATEPEKKVQKLVENMPMPLSPVSLRRAQSMSQWLLRVAAEQSGDFVLNIAEPIEASEIEKEAESPPELGAADTELAAKIAQRLEFSYPHAYAAQLPSKLTVTELKGRIGECDEREESAELKKQKPIFRKPDFLRSTRPLTGAERGTATHLVMQHIDLNCVETVEQIREEIKRLQALCFIDERQAQAADAGRLHEFFCSELGQRMRNCSELMREFRFSLLRPAREFFPDAGDEEILLQGVVDCCIVEGDALTILDFKTDYVTPATLEDKVRDYTPQLRAYSTALSQITKKTISAAVLYFFQSDDTVFIENNL